MRKRGAAACEGLSDLLKPLDLRLGHDQIGKPNARKKHLAERARIEHAPIAIQALQRRQRATDIAVLAVIVVLNDPCAVARSPVQQRQAPG